MILLVYGNDGLRVKERAEELVDKFAEKYDGARMNIDSVYVQSKAERIDARVTDLVSAAPFLSSKRMVCVRGVFAHATTKADAPLWTRVCERVPESTILVFVDELSKESVEKTELSRQLDGRQDMHRYVYESLTGAELRAWISARAREKYGAVLVPEVAEMLLARVGNSSWQLDSEIAKLSAYANGAPIDASMIHALVPVEYKEDVFGIIDALSAGKPEFALKKLSEAREAGSEEFGLFGMLVRQIRLLLQAKMFLEANPRGGKQEFASAFGAHPFVAQKVLAAASRQTLQTFMSWHARAGALDRAMKRGLPADIAVDRLLAALLDDSAELR